VRSFHCRAVRLDGFRALSACLGTVLGTVLGAALGTALAMPAMASTLPSATQTTLSAQTRDQAGRTQAQLSISVAGEDGLPASGAVVIEDGGRQLGGAALDAKGEAQVTLGLLPGSHALRAVYAGDGAHQASASEVSAVTAQSSSTPDFAVSVNPASLSLVAGQTGTVIASVTPVNAAALTAPMFVTLSCSGFPDQSSCSFTPENVEILPNATAPINSSMVIATQAQPTHGTGALTPPKMGGHSVDWAVLLPGVLGLAGMGFAARRRRWLNRLSLLGLMALVTVLGTTACSPLYNYYNHGPPYNLPTPAGSYTLTITAQSSNGVTATTHTTPLALTVKSQY